MSSHIPSPESTDLQHTLYRYGLSIAVLFDLLVDKGICTREEIQNRARGLNQQLWFSQDPDAPEEPWVPHP